MTAATTVSAPSEAAVAHHFAECARRTRRAAKNFYYAFWPLPAPKRRAIFALYAFARQADDLVDDESVPLVARATNLDSFRAAWADARHGNETEPYAWLLAVAHAQDTFALDERYFQALLDGCARDLTQTRYATRDDTRAYCFQVASAVGLLWVPVFGVVGDRAVAERAAEHLGYGMQMTNILRDIREDAARDRIYLAQESLAEHGVTESDVLAGRATPQFAALIRAEAARAREHFAIGATLANRVPRDARYCPAILAALYGRILARIERDPLAVLSRRISLSVPAKLWIAWRTWLGTFFRRGAAPPPPPSANFKATE